MQKQAQFRLRGMRQDLSDSKMTPEIAYENYNIRFTSKDDNTLFSMTNEKGTAILQDKESNYIGIKGECLGSCVINNILVLFVWGGPSRHTIYKIDLSKYKVQGYINREDVVLLFEGDLGFDVDFPIETLVSYENENIQKVYWIDGKNTPKFINIAAPQEVVDKYTDNSFNFIPILKLNEDITVTKLNTTGGEFAPGTIQYAFTYYNKYGTQSNIFHVTPINYVSFEDRGGNPEEKVSNVFEITLSNVDTNFDYIRMYSIQRTSINSTPIVKRVLDFSTVGEEVEYNFKLAGNIISGSYGSNYPFWNDEKEIYIYKNDKLTYLTNYPRYLAYDNSTEHMIDKTYIYTLDAVEGDYYFIKGKYERGFDYITNTGLGESLEIRQRIYSISGKVKERYSVKSFLRSMDYTSDNKNVIKVKDTGLIGDIIDPTELLFIGGEEIIPYTFEQKDGTLFLGNYKEKRINISKELKKEITEFFKDTIGGEKIKSFSSLTDNQKKEGYYSYKINLDKNSRELKGFKSNEIYRLGIQFQHNSGKWSEPIYIKDYIVDNLLIPRCVYLKSTNLIKIAAALNNSDIQYWNKNIYHKLAEMGYVKMRPMVVYPKENDRSCVCQGVLAPTVYNVGDRNSNSPFVQSSWFFRPNIPYDITKTKERPLESIEDNGSNDSNIITEIPKYIRGKTIERDSPNWERIKEYWDYWDGDGYVDRWDDFYYHSYLKSPEALDRKDPNFEKHYKEYILKKEYSLTYSEDYGSDFSEYDYTINYYIDDISITEYFAYPKVKILSASYRVLNPKYVDNEKSFKSNYKSNSVGKIQNEYRDWIYLGEENKVSDYSRAGILSNQPSEITDVGAKETYKYDFVNRGRWFEFRHNYKIPDCTEMNSEIQCLYKIPTKPNIDSQSTENEKSKEIFISNFSEGFYVDQSILTIHSPELEFDEQLKNTDLSSLKLRIIGLVPLTSFYGDIDIQASTAPLNYAGTETVARGFYSEGINIQNVSKWGYRALGSAPFWMDEFKGNSNNSTLTTTGFVVYPFHRNGSLNNDKKGSGDSKQSAKLDKKKMSNFRYSINTYYFQNSQDYWLPKYGTSDIQLYKQDTTSLLKLKYFKDSPIKSVNYYGSIDKVLVKTITKDSKNYPIVIAYDRLNLNYSHNIFSGLYRKMESTTSNDPVSMKYKSSTHGVIVLNNTVESKIVNVFSVYNTEILPTLEDSYGHKYGGDPEGPFSINHTINNYGMGFWEKFKNSENKLSYISIDGVQEVLKLEDFKGVNNEYNTKGPGYGWLWLGELYKPIDMDNVFGGKTEEAISNNMWVPCGESINIKGLYSQSLGNITNLIWEEGDTYHQRYDHIKTFPTSNEDQNAITEVISFMCDTRINLDARYDENRGSLSYLAITPLNFNKFNEVYNQIDNFFTFRSIRDDRIQLNDFPNTITWTKNKIKGELVDTWTNITLANSIDLDGDKGVLQSLQKFNNNLLAFQNKGLSQILYNENTQISSSEGIPIEIANSGKVQGKRYLADVGCSDKKTIYKTPSGIYFIDSLNKNVYSFKGQLDNISERLGMGSWFNKKLNSPYVSKNTFNTFYDSNNKDVLFMNYAGDCIAYSESLDMFTSLYSYKDIANIHNINGDSIIISDYTPEFGGMNITLHKMHGGDYNYFFGEFKPFYTTFICNQDSHTDKIFNTLEFRADAFKDGRFIPNETFDKLYTWNEYQYGDSILTNTQGKPSNLKQKFRVWRANIPRNNENKRDRMRNPWLYLKLGKYNPTKSKMILHDMVVKYFE